MKRTVGEFQNAIQDKISSIRHDIELVPTSIVQLVIGARLTDAYITPLLKADLNSDYVKSYAPISSLPVPSKLLE